MNCKTLTQKMHDYLDCILPEPEAHEIQLHISKCEVCRKMIRKEESLRSMLQDLPAPALRPGFAQRALYKARKQQKRQQQQRLGIGGAIAAGFVLFFVANLFLPIPESTINNVPEITLAMNQVRDIKLVFNSKESIDNAVFIVQLPNNLELNGFPDQHTISWKSKLQRGKNLLVLPVVAHGPVENDLIATIEHATKKKTFHLSIETGGINKFRSSYQTTDMA